MSVINRCDGCGREQRNVTGTWWVVQAEGWKQWLKVHEHGQWSGQCVPPYHFCSLSCIRTFIDNQSPDVIAPR